ncbi:ankyrin repeat domain-containing protein 6-like isoform X2 [Pecten maximus]|uniref:ankyrin repeat domain-containing protein 6-like isoform X2 n=1 Tax=Pecten maximus TaxID=6579 RepID=UPI001457EACC|nr:ankyrin repeat domain-containing protein 6-like isoform X2 [Pecten maximus]
MVMELNMSVWNQQLHLSVREGDSASVERLIGAGANINHMFYGWTPLQLAINLGQEEIAILLVNRGCDINVQDKNNVSPFEDAVNKRLCKVVAVLLEKGVDPDQLLTDGHTALCRTAVWDDQQLAKVLITGKATVDFRSDNGDVPLFVAAREGHSRLAQILLEAGADCNITCKEAGLQTPIIVSASHDHTDVIRVLLKFNCDVNAQDSDGWTALWHAYSNSSTDIMRLLLKSGADKNITNVDGHTILDEAKLSEDEDMVEILKKFGQSWT